MEAISGGSCSPSFGPPLFAADEVGDDDAEGVATERATTVMEAPAAMVDSTRLGALSGLVVVEREGAAWGSASSDDRPEFFVTASNQDRPVPLCMTTVSC